MLERLPRPINAKIDSNMWVDEAIWGHRLYDEQTPWLCFMEFLGVVEFKDGTGQGFIEAIPNSLSYSPKRRLYLRHILFNNPKIIGIASHSTSNPDDQWSEWVKSMDNPVGIDNPDFSYLRNRFTSFEDFAAVVDLLRSSTIEGENNKRWSSQFIFPFGPDCLYEDLNVGKNAVSNDRRFFARAGEMLYLMLCRSNVTQANELLDQIRNEILNPSNKFNRLVASLQPNEKFDADRSKDRVGAYLPYLQLPDYDELVGDWISVFRRQLANSDAVSHLVTLLGLHMLLYSMRRSLEVIPGKAQTPPTFILEIVAPQKTVIRDLSADSYAFNNSLSRSAVEAYIHKAMISAEWQEIVRRRDRDRALEFLREQFAWPRDKNEDDVSSLPTPPSLWRRFEEEALSRHQQHVNKFHSTWSREIGLSSRRGSRRIRYAPDDAFIKTLVLCVVSDRLEFGEFLQKLYDKYGFIIGDEQATDIIKSGRADQEDFAENAIRLEQRLASLGLLNRLSDACAYVENPLSTGRDKI